MLILQPMPNQPRGCFFLVGGPSGPNESTADVDPTINVKSTAEVISSQLKQLLQKIKQPPANQRFSLW
jgi:hypothetical protein